MPADDLGDTTVGAAYSHTLTASGGTGALSYSASGLPAGLSMSGSGTISGTATAAGDFSVAVTASDTAGQSASQAYPLKVYPAPALSPAALPDGTEGAAYSATVAASGGKAPLSLSQGQGALPAGLTFNAASGTLSGTPSTPGSSTFTLQARDANGATASQSYTITIAPALALVANVPATGNVGVAFSGLVSATGGKAPATYSVASGLLPPGLALSASAGTLAGTPTFAGSYTFTLAATDANGAAATRTVTVAIFANPPPAVTTTALANGVVGSAYLQTLQAASGQPPYAWSLATGSSLPAGLALSTSGQISGTPTAAGNSTFQVVATDANGQTARGNLAIAVFPPLSVGTTSLPEGYATLAYPATTLSASGGLAPYTWTLATPLPPGLTFTAGSATLSGTAAAGSAGSYGVTFTVSDVSGQTQGASFTITLYALPQVTTTTLADGSVGTGYSQLLQASGGKAPFTWAVTTGSLPAGILLDGASGALVGTPTAAANATFVVQVTDANGKTASRVLTLNVYAGLAVTYGPAPDGYTGTAYNQTLTAAGGRAPYTWSLLSGSLPPGVTLSTGGVLGGTPTAPGTFTFTLQVTDANSVTGTKQLTITIYDPPRITTSSLPDGYVGQLYPSVTLTGAAGKAPYTYAVTSGALPPGLSLSTAGVLSGTPTAPGSGSVTFTVTDANNATGTRTLSLAAYAVPSIPAGPLPDAYPSVSYSAAVTGTGGKAPYTFTAGAGLPAGLSMSGAGVITGNTTAGPGTATFTVTLTDANGLSASQSFSIIVRADVAVTTGALPDGYVTVGYSQAVAASGGKPPYTWSVSSGALPAGVNLDGATGVLGGTPAAAGPTSFTVRATDANGVPGSRTLGIQVYALPAITTASLPDATVNVAYNQPLAVSGGKAPFTWAITGAALPAGITFNTSTGTFSGTATSTSSTSPIQVTATDANGKVSPQVSYTLNVVSFITITTAAINDAYVGTAFSQTLAATGGAGAPYTFTVTGGALPAGLTLSSSGVLSGTPTAAGTASFTVTARDSGTTTGTKTFTQNAWGALTVTTASPLPDGYRQVSYSAPPLAASGGAPPLSWSVTSGALPAGLTLDSTSGNVFGTPTTSGTFTFTATVTDRNAQTGSKPLTLAVQPPLAVTKTSVVDGYVGRSYSDALTAAGGRPPYSWTVSSGSLPPGLSLASGGSIGGSPTAAGTSSFVVMVTDLNGTTATQALTMTVLAPPAITNPPFPDAYTGQAYSATATATGGKTPYSWSVSAGALPSGLALSSSTGAITGTASGATQTFTLTLSDANGVTATQTFTLAVYNLPIISSASTLPDGYASAGYSFTFAVTGGKAPFTWAQGGGAPPPGLTVSTGGVLGTAVGAAGQAALYSFSVSVTDANGRIATAPFSMTTYLLPSISNTSLTTATEGVTYLRAPGTPEQITATNGKAPLTFSATGLPAGLTASSGGVLSGIPAQGTAGPHAVTLTATDANGMATNKALNLQVVAARPIYGGGTAGVAPGGSPITDTLTVFTTDYEGRSYPSVAVRLRKNGVEFAPVKEQLTDASGKAVFTGLGLNGTTDTVDITVNSANTANEAFLKMNAAIVSIPLIDYPLPLPRAYASGEIDPPSGKLIVTGGINPAFGGTPSVNSLQGFCQNDLVRLADPVAGTWNEDLPSGVATAPTSRFFTGMAYSTSGFHVLFGGSDCNTWVPFNDVWLYSAATSTWTHPAASGAVPSGRDRVAMAGVGTSVLLFGGEPFGAFTSTAVGDLYSFNPTTATWTALNPPAPTPGARYNAGAVGIGNTMVVCGGNDGSAELADCWTYSTATGTWTSRAGLGLVREGFGMAATSSGSIYVFGGLRGGTVANDLLVSSGGAFTTVAAINPPPAREGATLAYESSTGRLILFGGQNQSTGAFYNDVWTFDPPTATWTQRTQTWTKPAVGFTLTGTISNAAVSSRSRVTIEASGLSGYVNRQILTLPTGSGTYTMTGIPAGDTISLTALNEDLNLSSYPNREWSWLDLGVISTNVSGNLAQNVALPSGPMTSQLLTTTGSYTLPTGYLGVTFAAFLDRITRPGYANHPNGFYQVTAAKTWRSDYFPPSPGTTETLIPEVQSSIAAACDLSVLWMYGVNPGAVPAVNFPPGPRSMSPGLNGCIPAGTGLTNNGPLQGSDPTSASSDAIADVNGDGIADVVFVNANLLYIFYGGSSGEGVFTFLTTLNLFNTGAGLAVADLDRNGLPDLVVGLSNTGQIAVFLQTAPNIFSFPINYGTGNNTVTGLAAGDFNGDTFTDVVVTGASGGLFQISELTGRGDGTFNFGIPVQTSGQVFSAIAAGELTGDTMADVVYGSQNLQIGFLRGAAGNLQPGLTMPVSGTPVSLAIGELSGDALADVVVATQFPSNLQVELNGGSLTFTQGANLPLPATTARIGIAEMNGDANRDVVVAAPNTLSIYRGTGGGGLSFSYSTPTSSSSVVSLALGDINADGNADVAVGELPGGSPGQVETFLAQRPVPAGTDTYSFVSPANTQAFWLDRGPSGFALDAEIFSRGVTGTNTATFPALSTLKPGRPSPTGQVVGWGPTIFLSSNPANFNVDNWSNARSKPDGQISATFQSRYRR